MTIPLLFPSYSKMKFYNDKSARTHTHRHRHTYTYTYIHTQTYFEKLP